MTAKKDGDSYIQIETDDDPEIMVVLTDRAMQRVLNTLQKDIIFLTNNVDDQRLTSLQACVGEIFRRAAQCRAQGKLMEISCDYQGGEPLQQKRFK